MLDSFGPRDTLSEQEPSSDTDSVRPEAERLDDVRPAVHPSVDVDLEWPTGLVGRLVSRGQAFHVGERSGRRTGRSSELRSEKVRGVFADLEKDVDGRSRRVQLSAAVVRDQYAVCPALISLDGVLQGA